MTLYQKKIVLGISGSIAAYKAPMIVRELIKRGAEVRVIMTPSAEKFVSKTVLMNLSKYPVAIEMFEDDIQSGVLGIFNLLIGAMQCLLHHVRQLHLLG